jgi:putative membrane protein
MHALTGALLAAALALYLAGTIRLWRRAGPRRGITARNAACFALGWVTVAATLLSPLHHYAEQLLWAHMVQHELLMVLAAPLFVFARPLEAFTWGLPVRWRRAMRVPPVLTQPGVAWTLHAAAVWLWHVPGVFEAAGSDARLHAAQHASFFLTAILFWWTALAPGPRALAGILSIFTTMLHTGGLGALMALAPRPWYAGYALEDQQLAGLVMWVPAGLAYPVAALGLVAQVLRARTSREAARPAAKAA